MGAAAGATRHDYSNKVNTCDVVQHEHPVECSDRKGHWYCDACSKRSTYHRHMLKLRYRCTAGCNFDLCSVCFAQMQAYQTMRDSGCHNAAAQVASSMAAISKIAAVQPAASALPHEQEEVNSFDPQPLGVPLSIEAAEVLSAPAPSPPAPEKEVAQAVLQPTEPPPTVPVEDNTLEEEAIARMASFESAYSDAQPEEGPPPAAAPEEGPQPAQEGSAPAERWAAATPEPPALEESGAPAPLPVLAPPVELLRIESVGSEVPTTPAELSPAAAAPEEAAQAEAEAEAEVAVLTLLPRVCGQWGR